jgi:hypothetical protein
MHLQRQRKQEKRTTTGHVVLARVTTLGALLLIAGLFGTGILRPSMAYAALQKQAALQLAEQSIFGVPHETSKVTLAETSNDGPAFWTQEFDGALQGPLTVLAWTGTDSQLNFVYSNNGASFFGKVTPNETAFARPAVVRGAGADGQASTAPVALARTGTDAQHHLNVATIGG